MHTSTTPSPARFALGHRERIGAARPLPFVVSPYVRATARQRRDEVQIASEIVSMGSPYEPYKVDQGRTGTCFACAPKIAIEQTLARAGTPLSFLISVLGLTSLVHEIERAILGSPSDPLWDWGGDPADVLTAISAVGVRRAIYRPGTDEEARRCDASPDTVGPDHDPIVCGICEGGVETPPLEIEEDQENVFLGAHELSDLDPVEQGVAAIDGGTCLTIAWLARQEDMTAPEGTVLDDRVGPPNHDSVVNGYRRRADGTYDFLLWNSWGDDWIDGGHAWVTEAFFRGARCRYATSVRRARVAAGLRSLIEGASL